MKRVVKRLTQMNVAELYIFSFVVFTLGFLAGAWA